jgi:uncharacterized protein with von Willebrand factor type A (vWA) domain
MNNRFCLECNALLKGRKDQKFCCDYCRNTFNNRLNEDSNSMVRKINRILRKNRRILEQLMANKHRIKPANELIELGYNFRYHTNTYQTNKGDTYVFCYELGYLKQENNTCLLVEKSPFIR